MHMQKLRQFFWGISPLLEDHIITSTQGHEPFFFVLQKICFAILVRTYRNLPMGALNPPLCDCSKTLPDDIGEILEHLNFFLEFPLGPDLLQTTFCVRLPK